MKKTKPKFVIVVLNSDGLANLILFTDMNACNPTRTVILNGNFEQFYQKIQRLTTF